MRRLHPLVVLAGLVLAASPALAQAPELRLRPKIVAPPPSGAADAGLRGPIDAAAAPYGTPMPGPGAATTDPSPSQEGRVAIAAAAKRPAVPPLPVVGDTAPICRAECAKTRIFCAGRTDGEDNCDVRWVECLTACAEPQPSPSTPIG